MSQGAGFCTIKVHDPVSTAAIKLCVGKRIENVRIRGDALQIAFDDGVKILFLDRAQDCCEKRYMVCDDDLSSFAGERFIGAELSEPHEIDGHGGVHDVQFLRIRLSSGSIVTCETHNEHSGHYGGFNVVARVDL